MSYKNTKVDKIITSLADFTFLYYIQYFPDVSSDLVLQDFNHFRVRYSQISHGDSGISVIEPLAQDLEPNSKVRSLDATKSFSEGMCSIISGQIDGSRPTLDHSVHGLDGQWPVLSGSRPEQELLWQKIFTGEVGGQGFMDGLVDHEDVDLPGFGFFKADGVTNSFSYKVLDFKAKYVASADSIVDAKGEEEEVSRLSGEELFDGADVVKIADGFDSDFAALGGMIGNDGLGHGSGSRMLSFCMISVSYLTFIGN